ncbi:MAG TPA: cell division protein ZapB [Thermoanaerobaculia bacterium]|nr:cell division protein ZapB [Thermoanaerobaculia bacterium]
MKKTRDQEPMPLAATEEGEILARLAERVERAVTTIQELRRDRDQLRARVEELEARLKDQDDAGARLESLEEEHERFKQERGEIRGRIETILSSLETLDGAE